MVNFKRQISKKLVFSFLVSFASILFVARCVMVQFKLSAEPKLAINLFARGGERIGAINQEQGVFLPYALIPSLPKEVFLAAEDDDFFSHGAVSIKAIGRSAIANISRGRFAEGASTITQQLARSVIGDQKKTIFRKIDEVILAYRLEMRWKKEEIFALYLSRLFFGNGTFGLIKAAEFYFHRTPAQLNVAQVALLAALQQAPSRYSKPANMAQLKARQLRILKRMVQLKNLSDDDFKIAAAEDLILYRNARTQVGPYYLESVKAVLQRSLNKADYERGGLNVFTSLDLNAQKKAEAAVRLGITNIDRRRGYRGPIKHLRSDSEVESFLKSQIDQRKSVNPIRLRSDGSTELLFEPNLVKEAVISKIEDGFKKFEIKFEDKVVLIDPHSLVWAHAFDPRASVANPPKLKKLSNVFAIGDVVKVKVRSIDNSRLEALVDQEPKAQGSLISFDQKSEEVIAMVGGYDFKTSPFNRALDAKRQAGSVFKAIVYASAAENGYKPTSILNDAPLAIDETDSQGSSRIYRPRNLDRRFHGKVTLQTSFFKSLNIPAIQLVNEIGADKVVDMARRLGVTSEVSKDPTLALGSSSVSLYEMTYVFSGFGRGGRKLNPLIVHKINNVHGQSILGRTTLYGKIDVSRPAISTETASAITSLLRSVIEHPEGTGHAAIELGRPAAGKGGTTNSSYDAWFIGYTPQIATGVWVGFDWPESLGVDALSSFIAVPIWSKFMMETHEPLPVEQFSETSFL